MGEKTHAFARGWAEGGILIKEEVADEVVLVPHSCGRAVGIVRIGRVVLFLKLENIFARS